MCNPHEEHRHHHDDAKHAFDWNAAGPRERDSWAARFVTGANGPPAYSTDPRAEYDLLRHVRETWPVGDLADFAETLWAIYRDRSRREPDCAREIGGHDALHVCYHRIGDYAHAAYLSCRPNGDQTPPSP